MKKFQSKLNGYDRICGHNRGIYKEGYIAWYFGQTGWKVSNTAFDKGSDLESFDISVKSARFTLASCLYGDTVKEKLNDYFSRVHSTAWAYVAKNGDIYLMNKQEFESFVLLACTLKIASKKNGGDYKVRMGHETKKVIQWLEGHI